MQFGKALSARECIKCDSENGLMGAITGFKLRIGSTTTNTTSFSKTTTNAISGVEQVEFSVCRKCFDKQKRKNIRSTVITIAVALALIPLAIWGFVKNETGYRYDTSILGLCASIVSLGLLFAMVNSIVTMAKSKEKMPQYHIYEIANSCGVKSPAYVYMLAKGIKLSSNENVELRKLPS